MTDQTGGEVSERLVQPATTRIFLFVMGPCLIYAGTRYHVAAGVPLALLDPAYYAKFYAGPNSISREG